LLSICLYPFDHSLGGMSTFFRIFDALFAGTYAADKTYTALIHDVITGRPPQRHSENIEGSDA
jgi:hypothetical protein